MNTGFQLFQLQRIDSEIDSSQKRIDEIIAEISNNVIVEKAKAKVEECESELKEIRSEFNAIDHDIQQKKMKKSQSESSLYGGKITNPKELQDLQMEIKSLTRILAELDTQLMDKLVVLDKSEKDLEQCKAELKKAVSEFETQKSMLTAEKNKLESLIHTQNEKKNSLVSKISQDMLGTYESLRESKNGVAVAELQDDSCSACGAFLTAGQCQQARSSSQLLFCPTCKRIVYGS
jgi:hypothetical protein